MATRRKVPNYGAILKAYDREARRLEKEGHAALARDMRRCALAVAEQERQELAEGARVS